MINQFMQFLQNNNLPVLDEAATVDLINRLRETANRSQQGALPGILEGPVSALPSVMQPGIRAGLAPMARTLDAVDVALDASNYGSTLLTGAGIAGAGLALETLGLNPDAHARTYLDRARQAAPENAGLLSMARETNQQAAREHPYLTGLANAATDPTNVIPLGGPAKGAAVSKGAGALRLGKSVIDDPAKVGQAINRTAQKAAGGLDEFKRTGKIALEEAKKAQTRAKLGYDPAIKAQLDNAESVLTQRRDAYSTAKAQGLKGQQLNPLRGDIRTATNDVKDLRKQLKETENVKPGFSAFERLFRQQQVLNWRNIILDKVSMWFLARDVGLQDQAALRARKDVLGQMERGNRDIRNMLPERTRALSNAWGVTDRTPADLGEDLVDLYTSTGARELNPAHSAAGGAMLSLMQPAWASVPGVGVAAKAGLEYFRPAQNAIFTVFDKITKLSWRSVAWEDAAMRHTVGAKEELFNMLDSNGMSRAKNNLVKISQKKHAQYSRAGVDMTDVPDDVLFNADDVRKLFGAKSKVGPTIADAWQTSLDEAAEAGNRFSKEVFMDFSQKLGPNVAGRPLEDYVSAAFPFSSWTMRALPRIARTALNHPLGAFVTLRALQLDSRIAEAEGRPSYQVGTIPISTEVPVLGNLAKFFTQGREGEIRLNPLQSFSPVPGQFVTGGEVGKGENKTAYQQATDLTELIGMSPHPIIQAIAYATNQDYQAPTGPSRQANQEQLLPGPELPSLLHGTLRAGREAAGGDIDYDPVERVARELVFERTGKTSADPSNKALAVQIAKKEGVYKEAETILKRQRAATSTSSLVNPVNIQVQSQTNKDYRRARAEQPFQREELLELAKTQPSLAVQLAQLQQESADPVASVYKEPKLSKQDKADPRIQQFRAENAVLARVSPRLYNRLESEFAQTLGIR